MSQHTYIVEPDRWHSAGDYFDQDGAPVPATGSVEIVHNPDHWLIKSRLGIEGMDQYEKETQIEALRGQAQLSRWEATDSIMGKIQGTYILLDDTILSWYHSIDRVFHGYEFLKQLDSNRYEAAGAIFKEQLKTGSWMTLLTRVQ